MPEVRPQSPRPQGYLSFTLHAHLPWVVNHGAWPHGMDWLHEAAAETYLPLLRMLERLERDGIRLRCNLNLSPVLLEQLAHPVFQSEFPRYLERKVAAAREDEAVFLSTGMLGYGATARSWQAFYATALDQFAALGGRIHDGFRRFHDSGSLELMTTGVTHAYFPLLGTDESLRAQVRLALATHERHLGLKPRGLWIPECGYRPAGTWNFPVQRADGAPFGEATSRPGIEQILAEEGLEYFLVDSHLMQGASTDSERGRDALTEAQRLYRPWLATSPAAEPPVAVFPRDPVTGVQVWSGDHGYPADFMYLDFHKKRWPGGHRYWRVTGAHVDIADKDPYEADAAAERVRSHAEHFVDLVWRTLQPGFDADAPPVLSAPFDAELFGHWWFEGTEWLEQVARILHTEPTGLAMITASEYLDLHPPAASVALPAGSWGAGGGDQVWLNDETAWTYRELYAAELELRSLCAALHHAPAQPIQTRVLQQMCRELLLLESSDWQFLITTGAARDYAEQRFRTHLGCFSELRAFLADLAGGAALRDDQLTRLAEIEQSDSLFPEIDPTLWCSTPEAIRPDSRVRSSTAQRPKTPVVDGTRGELPKYLPQTEA